MDLLRLRAALPVVALALAGCSGDDAAGPTDPTGPSPVSPDETAAPMVDDSPFCRTMLALDDVGEDGDGPDLDDLIGAYVEVADDVPPAIRAEFDVVLARMVAVAAGDDEALGAIDPVLVEESTIELAEFIERRCRGTLVSPLPPPTVPDGLS